MSIRFHFSLTIFFFLSLFQSSAFAFPEMIRYGYVNCGACHISQTGGGVLYDYGREISREKLALFKSSDEKSKEHLFAYGALSETPLQKMIQVGGDIRSVYSYQNNAKARTGQTIFMQGDAEIAATVKKLTVVGTLGVEQPILGQNLEFISRRHFIHYAITDEIGIRAGKFFSAYGIKTPDHITLTRDRLALGDNFESYNLELSFINAEWSAFLTGNFGRFDDKHFKQDRGTSAQLSYAPTERLKVGTNVWYGERLTQFRTLVGVFGLWGMTNELSFQSEIDAQLLHSKVPGALPVQNGAVSTQKISYELKEGLWVYGLQEFGKFNFKSESSQNEVYGIGVQIFPRTHFEFNVSYEKARNAGPNSDFGDIAYFMSHFYL